MTKAILIAILCLGVASCQQNSQDAPKLKTLKDSASYSIGISIGKNMKKQDVDVDPAILASGLRDAIGDKKAILSDEDIQKVMNSFQADIMKKQQEKAVASSGDNKKKGVAFLEENKKKEGVKVTASGLQYKVLKTGTGKQPVATSTVKTHYKGTLIDGKEFDSSYKRNEPAEFPVSNVIKGWTEALQLMHEGDKWELYVPSELAYGDQGAGADIPPGSTLIFEVELISVVK